MKKNTEPKQRITIVLSEKVAQAVRSRQASAIKNTNSSYSFSKMIELFVVKGLKA